MLERLNREWAHVAPLLEPLVAEHLTDPLKLMAWREFKRALEALGVDAAMRERDASRTHDEFVVALGELLDDADAKDTILTTEDIRQWARNAFDEVL